MAALLRWSTLAGCALSSAVVTVACGNSGSGGDKGAAGASAAAGSSSPSSGATGGQGGTAGRASATGGSGGTSGGSAGSTGGSGAGMSGGAGGAVASGGSGGSVMAGASGTTPGSGGSAAAGSGATGGDATGGGSGGSAGSPAGGTGNPSGGDAGAASGGKGGSGGGLTGATPSKGCGKSGTPEDGVQMIDVGGTSREYIIRVPPGYDANTPSRIIYAFHGMQGSDTQVDKGDPPNAGLPSSTPYYDIKENADPDVIFVAGQALSGGWTNSNGRDIDYVKAIVAHLEDNLCIDQSRRFATGFSFGAIMTITVACNLSDVFRAVAAMSGSLQNGCPAGGQSIAYWASHGTMDTTIDISKGEAARDEFVTRNGCDTTTMASTPDGCVAYQGCKAGYPVNWCPFDGIHQPPPFSGPAIWAFLSQF